MPYASTTAWNREQKITRMNREIAHFRARADQHADPQTQQQRRARTVALRCLAERERDLQKIIGGSHDPRRI